MINNFLKNIIIELRKKHFYLMFLLGIIIFIVIIVTYFITRNKILTKDVFSLLTVSSMVCSLMFVIIFLIKKGFWNSISKSYRESKISVGSFKDERKMLKMSQIEKQAFREEIKKKNQEKINKPKMNNLVLFLNSIIFGILFITFLLIYLSI
ncbi:hypothetical protein [Mycoplasmopsis cynos]|uniref:DUF3899 domain-containing protein n=3 Tax=Mycoplasmopsis cynos TaxID=171284 RepID=A0A449AHY2_9BACT|nr:hypothetical protein [Mycoplasmopsis cynos]MCU9933466.1 hypothetical protein [Mycoplasmopsis cynos]TQC54440.1 hypothetical protein E1I74_03360 [Mycoplasmopsis cynos]UWV77271.1 hypothetical protein NW070_06225 [Mycoplasmopsis cynos]UWV80872.1 hypothetical protein NW069_01790 [Mycoplasmopsis cynos]UWV81863.1 hypothetical protein NW065_01850 [Mycoplasmopsis cynos]